MTRFDTIEYLKNGNPKQIKAYEVLTKNNVVSKIAEFSPILVGTIPINIDIETSDLDIACYWKDKNDFTEKLKNHFGNALQFSLREIEIDPTPTVIANFMMDGFEVEIFGQSNPVKQQNAYRHMIIEHQILQEKGEEFRQQVIRLKQKGYKTEPAFGLLLGLKENPYLELLDYKT